MGRLKRLKRVPWLFVIGGSLFWPAGTLAWPQGWIFFVEFNGGTIVTMSWLKRHDPALYEERLNNPRRDAQPLGDKLFGLSMLLAWYGWIIFMSLGKRWGWSHMPAGFVVLGAAVIPLGYLLAASALKANSFAATAVRLQHERGQKVIDRGPYAVVRHPMYTGSVIIHIGTALLLGSVIGLAFVIVLAAMLGVRAVLEEGLLRRELPGYCDYMTKVRYRLVPFIW